MLHEARELIAARYAVSSIEMSAVNVDQLASWTFGPPLTFLSIGTVYASVAGGTWAMVDIVITADGRLAARLGWNMRKTQDASAPDRTGRRGILL